MTCRNHLQNDNRLLAYKACVYSGCAAFETFCRDKIVEEIKIENLHAEPYFDLEDFMNFSKESRLEGDAFEKLAILWDNWLGDLRILNMSQGNKSWLAVYLPEAVEKQIDNSWDESPGQGYLMHNLAQFMCMSCIQELLPQVAAGGCAPSPAMTPKFRDALRQAGLVEADKDTIGRRYAVLTYYPFRGGCEVCSLRKECPKGNGMPEIPSVVLPGFERGRD